MNAKERVRGERNGDQDAKERITARK